jgi:hypothetical protein
MNMAKKTIASEVIEGVVEQTTGESTEGVHLISTGFLKCDGIRYQTGDPFPFDHPEAERLFDAGVLAAG